MNRGIRIWSWFLAMGSLFLGSTMGMTCHPGKRAPEAPGKPLGPNNVLEGDTAVFRVVVYPHQGESLAARLDWGDGTLSDWSKFATMVDTVLRSHVWHEPGTNTVKAQAMDSAKDTSAWSDGLPVTVVHYAAVLGGTGHDVGNSVQQTSDGGYIIAGSTSSYGAGGNDIWLIKTDTSGNKVWDKTFGGPGDDGGRSVQQTSDGGYIIVGFSNSFGSGYYDIWLIKTNALGNETWDKTFGGTSGDYGNSVRQTSDGGFIVAGHTDYNGQGGQGVWLVKTDASGNKIWDTTFGVGGFEWGHGVQQTTDGGFIIVAVACYSGSGLTDVWLIKTDSSGNKIWDATFGGARSDYTYSVQQTLDGGYIVTGSTQSYGASGSDVWLTKTDSSGKEVWNKTFGGTRDDEGRSVRQTSDGGYIITGSTGSAGTYGSAVWLIKTDGAGNRLWDRTFGGSQRDDGNSVQQTMDGGYIIVGSTYSFGAGDADILLIKTDAEGN